MSDVRIINADCLDALAELPDASVDCVVTDPPSTVVGTARRKRCSKGNHSGPVARPMPAVPTFHGCPVMYRLTPNGIVLPFLRSKRESVNYRNKTEAGFFAVNSPDKSRFASATDCIRFQEAKAGAPHNLSEDVAIVVTELQREVAGIVAAALLSVDAKASLAVDKPREPITKGVVNHSQLPTTYSRSLS